MKKPKFRRAFNGRLCPHLSYSIFSAAMGTVHVNSAGTHQVCIGCDWKRPLKKWVLAFRKWAKRRSEQTGQPVGVILGTGDACSAFEAGWKRGKAC